MTLDDLGLVPTLKRFFESFAEQNGIEYKFEYKGAERRLVSYLDVLLFRAVQELLANSVEHNKDYPVKLQLYVQVIYEDNLVRVIVRDNGKGFDTPQIESIRRSWSSNIATAHHNWLVEKLKLNHNREKVVR